MIQQSVYVGQRWPTKNYGGMLVVDYINNKKVRVRFVDTGYETYASAQCVKKGDVKDPLRPNAYGVGYIGVGTQVVSIKRKSTKAYANWRGMLARCYCPKTQARQPTYIDCTVDSIWHNFQTFAKWHDEHYVEGFELDKDIKVKDNKVYGPDTCMYVSQAANAIEAAAKHFTFINPEGEIVEVYNLRQFCRDNGLSDANLHKVHTGKYKHHKQWRKHVNTTK